MGAVAATMFAEFDVRFWVDLAVTSDSEFHDGFT